MFKDEFTRLHVLDLFCQLGQSMFKGEETDKDPNLYIYEKIVQKSRADAIKSDITSEAERAA